MPVGASYSSSSKTVDYTPALNIVSNTWGRINELGLFTSNPVASRVVIIDRVEDSLVILPETAVGGPASVATNVSESSLPLIIPHFPHDDYILPSDIQDRRLPGSTGPTSLENKRSQKLITIRKKHALTLEFLRIGALKGIIIGGTGNTLYNLYTQFGITQYQVDMLLTTEGTNVQAKIWDAKRHIEDNIQSGEMVTGYHCLCSSDFFDALTSHPTVIRAFENYTSRQELLRSDVRRNFEWNGVTFEEYRASAKLAGASTATQFLPDGEAYLYPTGTSDMFVNFFAPANDFRYVNTLGQESYVFEDNTNRKKIMLESESNTLPINRRPQAVVKLNKIDH